MTTLVVTSEELATWRRDPTRIVARLADAEQVSDGPRMLQVVLDDGTQVGSAVAQTAEIVNWEARALGRIVSIGGGTWLWIDRYTEDGALIQIDLELPEFPVDKFALIATHFRTAETEGAAA
jgi:hypothetical protein